MTELNWDFLNMKVDNGLKAVTKYVILHDRCYYDSLKKGKNLDEKTDAEFYKGAYDVFETFMGKDINNTKIDDEFVAEYEVRMDVCDDKIRNIVRAKNNKLVAKDKIEIAYLNGKITAYEKILADIRKFLKSQQKMKGHCHKVPSKRNYNMVGNIKGLENSVKKIF